MRDTLLAEFEDQVAELRERLPETTGDLRRDALAELESLTEFLDLIALLREPRRLDGGEARRAGLPVQALDAVTSAKPWRQEA